ncbi:MAG: hypothetical protein CMN04_08145 [Roseibacillus sp.]|nr:hypothetical protein [Roseibacillus sp.]|tara:strand:- start:9379 stop:11391 length:2013 start_codon:yes stop_codon:yes gene_type:complete
MLHLFRIVAFVVATAAPALLAAPVDTNSSLKDWMVRLIKPGIRQGDARLAQIDQELSELPKLYTGPRGSRFGFHSETIIQQTEPHYVQIDLGEVRPLDSVVLLPVHLPTLGPAGEGYGFPIRFKIEVSKTPTTGFRPIADHTEYDFSNPGRYPIKFSASGFQGRFVRVTSTKHVPAKGGFVWAMEEIMIFSGNYNIATARPRAASSTQELFPNWSLQRINDGISRVGNPHEAKPSPTNGFLSARSASASDPKWIIVDLGQPLPVDEIRIIPTSSDHPEIVGGRGFPKSLTLELSNDSKFETTVWRTRKYRHPLGFPWDSALVLRCNGEAGRYLRLASKELFARGDMHSFAISELQAYHKGVNLALHKKVSVSDQSTDPSNTGWSPQNVVDGFSSSSSLIELPDYIDVIIDRGALENERTQLVNRQSKDTDTALTRLTIGVATIGGIALVGWIWMIFRQRSVRTRDSEKLRKQIARDLHDDIGSNLAGIVLISEVGSTNQDACETARDDFREIQETAEQTAEAMRDIVWLIDTGEATTRDLFMRMRESIELIVGQLDTSVHSIPPSQKSRPIGLQARRHFFFAFKEALNNVQKHANATKVQVVFELTPSHVTFEVVDDGVGFEPEAVKGTGHGLKNFHRRANRVNGQLKIDSMLNKGTTIRFSAPLNQRNL